MKLIFEYVIAVCFALLLMAGIADFAQAGVDGGRAPAVKTFTGSVSVGTSATTIYTAPSNCKRVYIKVYVASSASTQIFDYSLNAGSSFATANSNGATSFGSPELGFQAITSTGGTTAKVLELYLAPSDALKGTASVSAVNHKYFATVEY